MTINQFSLFFVTALLATLLSLYLGLNAARLKHTPAAAAFSWMMILVAIWTGSVAIGMLAPDEKTAFLWILFRMIGVILAPVAWLFMVFLYIGKEDQTTWKSLILLSVIPIFSILMLATNSAHHLFVTDIEYFHVKPFLVDEIWSLGPYFYLHLIYSYSLTMIGDALILREAFHIRHKYRRQAISLFLGALIPLLFNISYTFHLIPGLKVNYDPLGLVISGLILAWGVIFNDLFELAPIARSILVDNMVDGMIVANQKGIIIDLNPAAEKIFHISQQSVGKPLHDLFQDLGLPDPMPPELETRNQIEIINQDNEYHWYEIQATPVYTRRGIRGKLISARDISDQKRIEARLQEVAITDALTGLANHRHFYDLLEQEAERAKRNFQPLSIILFDIDHFKQVNDTHGHLVGDQLLQEMASLCNAGLRGYDILCRYGGEEFSVILPGSGLQTASATAERLRLIVASNIFHLENIDLHLTISLGVSSFDPGNPISLKTLMEQADRAMYQSKENGRNLVSTYGDG